MDGLIDVTSIELLTLSLESKPSMLESRIGQACAIDLYDLARRVNPKTSGASKAWTPCSSSFDNIKKSLGLGLEAAGWRNI